MTVSCSRARYSLAFALAVASGCSDSTATLDTTSPPAKTPVTARIFSGVAYAAVAPAQRLDLFLPPSGNGPFPVIVFIHGGGWSAGSRVLDALSPQRQLTLRGYAVASIDYRLSGTDRYPAAVRDVKAAIRYLRAYASRYSLDASHIALWGTSAGAHLAALVGLTGNEALFDDASLGNIEQSARVQAIISQFAPTDLLTMDIDGAAQRCPLFNGSGHDAANSPEGLWLGARPSTVPDRALEASPLSWVSADDPPILIQHGGADCTVPTAQSVRLRERLTRVVDTARVTWTLFPADGHGGGSFEGATNVNTIVAFVDRWLR